MDLEQLQNHFRVFGLTTSASLNELDAAYNRLSTELHKNKADTSALLEERKQSYDDSYIVLLRLFIRQDCKEDHYRGAMVLRYDNIMVRGDERVPNTRSPSLPRRVVPPPKRRVLKLRTGTIQNRPPQIKRLGLSIKTESSNASSRVINLGEQVELCDNKKEMHPRQQGKPFEIVYVDGDVFEAPDNAVIIHAVNSQGVWGAGFAKTLKLRYPAAFVQYAKVCRDAPSRSSLVGNCVLIPPQPADYRISHDTIRPRHWIACLYTSYGYGRPSSSNDPGQGRDTEDLILMNTDSALVDLEDILKSSGTADEDDRPIADLYSPKFNSGNFGVAWDRTEELLKVCLANYPGKLYVFSPISEDQQPECYEV